MSAFDCISSYSSQALKLLEGMMDRQSQQFELNKLTARRVENVERALSTIK
jgi:predicted transcriptional regulator